MDIAQGNLQRCLVQPSSHLSHQFLTHSLVDTEETCFNMADACVKAGSAGCKLVELIPEGGDKNDVGVLLNGAHDVIDSLRGWSIQLTLFLH